MTRTPRIVFIHVPKTGGTTFREMLRRSVGPVTVCDEFAVDDVTAVMKSDPVVELHAFVHHGRPRAAHIDVVQHAHRLVLRDAAVFCLLRDPVDALLSTYRHVRANPETWLPSLNAGTTVSPSAEEFAGRWSVGEAQLRFLSDRMLPHDTVRQADVDAAIEWMTDLNVTLGVLQDLPEFFRAFEQRVGVSCRLDSSVVLNAGTVPISPEDEAAFRSVAAGTTRLDHQLYQHALAMVAARAASPRV